MHKWDIPIPSGFFYRRIIRIKSGAILPGRISLLYCVIFLIIKNIFLPRFCMKVKSSSRKSFRPLSSSISYNWNIINFESKISIFEIIEISTQNMIFFVSDQKYENFCNSRDFESKISKILRVVISSPKYSKRKILRVVISSQKYQKF